MVELRYLIEALGFGEDLPHAQPKNSHTRVDHFSQLHTSQLSSFFTTQHHRQRTA